MVKAVSLIKSAGNIFHSSATKRTVSKPIAEIGEQLSGKSAGERQLLPGNSECLFDSVLNRLKNFWNALKPKQKILQNYTAEISEKAVDGTLEKYLECYQPAKIQYLERFKSAIRTKLSKFYLQEARKAEEILTKNKTVFEELDKNYQLSLDKIMQEVKLKKLSGEEAYEYLISEKGKVDQEFANKILDIFAKEYNLEEIKPVIECGKKLKGRVTGGWNAVMGKITIDSSKFTNSAKFVGTLFHEYTHFRQDIETFKILGEKEYIKYLVVRMGLRMNKDNSPYAKLSVPFVFAMIKSNSMYKKLGIYAKEHSGTKKGFERNLIRMRLIENINYKDYTYSYDEYVNQLGELHAHHNGDYFRELYKQIFPDYATVRSV